MLSPRQMLPAALLAAGLVAGCGGTRHETVDVPPPSGSGSESAEDGGSQAAKTRSMEAQAADLEQSYRDAVADPNATEEEKLRAYQEFEAGRQRLNETGESDPGEGDSGGDG